MCALLPKVHAFLKPDGHFVVLVMAWLPLESPIAKVSETLILKYNPTWTGANWKREPKVCLATIKVTLFTLALYNLIVSCLDNCF